MVIDIGRDGKGEKRPTKGVKRYIDGKYGDNSKGNHID